MVQIQLLKSTESWNPMLRVWLLRPGAPLLLGTLIPPRIPETFQQVHGGGAGQVRWELPEGEATSPGSEGRGRTALLRRTPCPGLQLRRERGAPGCPPRVRTCPEQPRCPRDCTLHEAAPLTRSLAPALSLRGPRVSPISARGMKRAEPAGGQPPRPHHSATGCPRSGTAKTGHLTCQRG